MAVRLPEVERAYFVRKLGVNADNTKPLNQIKREYFAKFVASGNATTPFNELELRWILKVLNDATITPANPNSMADLWKQMVLAVSQTPVRNIDQNRITFYLNAP